MTNFDVYMVGVGGQGILTIGEILSSAALNKDIPVNFYPSKGMAQRGGFVKAQLRMGSDEVGPSIRERGADLVFAMEVSEALKAVRYIKPGGDFVLFGHVWAPTAVMLGKADYPKTEDVIAEIKKSGANVIYINTDEIPSLNGRKAADNIFMLGTAMKHTKLGKFFSTDEIDSLVQARWKKASAANHFAFQAGMDYEPEEC